MNDVKFESVEQQKEVDILRIIGFLWSKKFIIVASTLFFGIIFAIYALSLPNIYKAQTLLQVVEDREFESAPNFRDLSALSSFTGISLPKSRTSKAVLGIEVMKSKEFIAKFATDDVLINLFASKKWNSRTNEIVYDSNIFDYKENIWTRKASFPRSAKPSPQEAHKLMLTKVLEINQDEDTGLIRVSAKHVSPYVAKNWVDKVVEGVNMKVRNDAINLANNSISYLQAEIQNTNVEEIKIALSRLIQNELSTISVANSNPEYLFNTIDMAVVPEEKFGPNRFFIVFFGMIIGFVVGIISTVSINHKQFKNLLN